MWLDDKGYFGQYIYGRYFRSFPAGAPWVKHLPFCLILLMKKEKIKVVQNTPITFTV